MTADATEHTIPAAGEGRYTFPEGILGFEHIKTYDLLDKPDTPFLWLNAVEYDDLSFIIMRAADIDPDYRLKIGQADLDLVQAASFADLEVFFIVTIPDDPKEMTANFQGPVILNRASGMAAQGISLNPGHKGRRKGLDVMKEHGEN